MTDQVTAAILSDKVYETLITNQVFGPSNRYQVLTTSDMFNPSISSGYYGAIILDKQTNTNYLVNRGTEPYFLSPDFGADANIVFSGPGGSQFNDAREFLASYNAQPGAIPVSVATGHSLGGLLSQAVGIANNLGVITFGSPGGQGILNNLELRGYAAQVASYNYGGKMFHFVAENDPVGNFGQHIAGSNVQFIDVDHLVDRTLLGRIISDMVDTSNFLGWGDEVVFTFATTPFLGGVYTATKEGAKIVYHNMDNYRSVVAGEYVQTINSPALVGFASTENGDTFSVYKSVVVHETVAGTKTAFYERNDGDLYGLVTNIDGSKGLTYKDQSGNTVLKSFSGLENMQNLTTVEQHIVQEISYRVFVEEREAAKDLLQRNPDIINDPEFGTLSQSVQGHIVDLLLKGQIAADEEALHQEIIDGSFGSDSVGGRITGDGLGTGAQTFNLKQLAWIIQNGGKEDQIGAALQLYDKIKSEGTFNSATGTYTLGNATIQSVANNFGGTAVKISVDGIAQSYITKYGQGNFQQRVVETVGLDGRTNSAEITLADGLVNQLYRGEPIEINYPEKFVFGFAGGYVGNLIGQQLVNGELAHDVIVSAITQTVGSNLGEVLDFLAAGQNNLSQAIFDPFFGVNGTAITRPSMLNDFLSNLQMGVASVIGGKITEELGDLIDIGGVGREIFDVVAGTVTTGLINGGFGFIFNQMNSEIYAQIANHGFAFDTSLQNPDGTFMTHPDGSVVTSGDYIQTQIFNAVAAYAGQRLAGELIQPESEIAAIFGSAGSVLAISIATNSGILADAAISLSVSKAFATFGTTLAPVIGTIIGAFIGSIAGTALGNAFGGEDHPSSFTFVDFNPATKLYQMGNTYTNDGGSAQLSADMADAVLQGVNDIIAATGGTVRHTSVAPELDIGWKEGTFFVNIRDGAYHEFGSAGDAISFAALHTLKNFDLVGGHAVVMRAWHNSEATTIQEWKEDIEVAEAFQLYLTNPTGILAMMIDQPDSAAAQSWAAILKRAGELQLHLPHERDLDGGWNELLLARGDIDPSLIPNIEGDSIVLTDPSGHEIILHHVIGPGYKIVRIEGTDGNDIIQVIVDGPSITHVDAGAGDDIIEGSDQRDIILGGSGDDTINGNAGDDWINGGSGEDTVHGNGGLDLIYGGDDNDQLFGDEDADAVYGGKGDDNLQGLAGNDELFGGAGNDTLNGNEGVDVLKGEQGDDTLHGNNNDKLYGGQGNDTYYLTGSAGSQANIARGEGHDVIYGNTTYVSYIRFDYNISPNELWFQASGNDLMIKVLGEDQSILVKDIFNTANPSKFFIYFGDQLRITTSNGVHDGNSFLWKEAHLNSQHVAAGTWSGPSDQYNYMTDANLLAKYNAYQTWVNQGTQPSWMLDPFNGVQGHGWENVSLGPDPKYFGTTGNDLYGIAPGGDYSGPYVFGSAGNDTITVPQSFSYQTYDWVYGDSGNDVINGGYGGDLLVGGLGDDTIDGQAGNDKIYGGYGNDTLMGQDSQDIIYGGAGNDNILGQQGWDTLFGGNGDDYIEDYHGGNSIYGEAGNDTITITGVSDNLLDGGDGSDIITAHNGNDRLYGGAGNDTLDGAGGNDLVNGDAGDDTLKYTLSSNLTNQDVYDGGTGLDKIVLNLTAAQFAQDAIKRDLLRLREQIAGQQTLINFTFLAFALSVSGVEAMEAKVDGVLNNIAYALTDGTASAETMNGTSAHEHIKGNDGADTINGNAGSDYLEGGIGNDSINGGDGFDDIKGGADNDTLSGGNGDDDIQGDDGDDSIFGDTGNDVLYGGDGADSASGGIGDDTVSGGSGDDVLTGGDGNDKLLGDSGNDTLSGNAGNDTLEGGAGDDILEGGTGADALLGGIGNDEYRFNIGDGHDTLSDNSGTADIIRLGAGIAQASVSITALVTNDLKITFASQPNDSITLLKQGTTAGSALTVEKLVFSDNSEINLATTLAVSIQNDQVSAVEDVSIAINVLTNDNALNGNTLKITAVTDAPHGSVVLNANGTITYTSDIDYVGSDNFTYTVSDIFGHTATGTVSLAVAQAPLNVINGTASAETINGTVNNDLIHDLGGNDTVNGLGGADTFVYTAGFDIYNGGAGVDMADFTGFSWAVWVDLDYGTNDEAWTVDKTSVYGGEASNVWRAIANLNDVENVKGSNYHDRLIGNNANADSSSQCIISPTA